MTDTNPDDSDRLEQYIRDEMGHLPSIEGMVTLANWLYANEFFETNDREVATSALEESVDHRVAHEVGTILGHLLDIDVVDEVSRGGGAFILHERSGRAFFDPNNREMIPLLEEEISRFLADLRESEGRTGESTRDADNGIQSFADGGELNREEEPPPEDDEPDSWGDERPMDVPRTLRGVAASALSVAPEEVEEALTGPRDHIERMSRFDSVVTSVIESDEVDRGREYEPMGWQNAANRWVLTKQAKARKENQSLFG